MRNAAVLMTATLLGYVLPCRAAADDHWVRSWGTALQRPDDPEDYPGSDRVWGPATLRQTIRTSIGGNRFVVRLSNRFGTVPLVVGAARLALGQGGGKIDPASDRVLRFAGAPGVTIPPGGTIASDPVTLSVPMLRELAVSLYLPRGWGKDPTLHYESRHATHVAEGGDRTGDSVLAGAVTCDFKYFLEGLDTAAPGASAVVAIGDSITDGYKPSDEAWRTWPDRLAERLAPQGIAVVNAGITSNQLLADSVGEAGTRRFDRDALDIPGVATIVVLEGINDIWEPDPAKPNPVGPGELIAGYENLIERAHWRGLGIVGATLIPDLDPGITDRRDERTREAANRWIREGKAFDAIVDFDALLRDPGDPLRLKAEYDSGDHVHPNDRGYALMAEAVARALADLKGR